MASVPLKTFDASKIPPAHIFVLPVFVPVIVPMFMSLLSMGQSCPPKAMDTVTVVSHAMSETDYVQQFSGRNDQICNARKA